MNTTQTNEGRLLLSIKKFLTEKRRTLLIGAGAYIGISILIGIWAGLMGAVADGEMVLYIFMAGMLCTVSASMLFSDMATKEGKISLLMTPARISDKFLARLLTVVPGSFAVAIIGFYAMAGSIIVAHGFSYGIWVKMSPIGLDLCCAESAMLFSMFLLNLSFFIYGAVAWPKKSFIKTLGLLVVLQLILSFLLMTVIRTGFIFSFHLDPRVGEWTFTAVMLIIAGAITYGAYHRLKHTYVA